MRGRVTHVLSWFEDVTERRALEMRLIASDRLAFLGQLVAGVAHEVSNPLAGIAGCAEALASLAMKGDRQAQREARRVPRPDSQRGRRAASASSALLLDAARRDAGDTADVAATRRHRAEAAGASPGLRARDAWSRASRRACRARASSRTRCSRW